MKKISFLIILSLVNYSKLGAKNDNKIITMPTLGQQPIVLGGLFTAYKDQFIPGLSIFNSEVKCLKILIDLPLAANRVKPDLKR